MERRLVSVRSRAPGSPLDRALIVVAAARRKQRRQIEQSYPTRQLRQYIGEYSIGRNSSPYPVLTKREMRDEVRGPMQDREAKDLRRRVARLKRDRPGFRFPAALRSEITTWVAKQRERGEWWCELARAIDVPAETLKRWATPRRDAVEMLPVHQSS